MVLVSSGPLILIWFPILERAKEEWGNPGARIVRFAKHFVPFGKAHLYTMRETGAAARVSAGLWIGKHVFITREIGDCDRRDRVDGELPAHLDLSLIHI